MLAVIAFLVIITARRAFQSALDQSDFPENLAIKMEAMPVIFVIHMVTGGLALLLVPVTILLRYTRYHRWMGRLVSADVAVAGATAIPVAMYASYTIYSGAGFIAQALTWMTLLAAGIWNIRQGRVKAHQACMLMMAAVTSGAVFFRIYLGLWATYGTHHYFKLFYSIDAWIGWLIPLTVTAAVLYFRSSPARGRRGGPVTRQRHGGDEGLRVN